MNEWTTSRRHNRVVNNTAARNRGSATQKWIKKSLLDNNANLRPPPKVHNSLTRNQGVLIAKARTNRWTQCNWYLQFIKQRENNKCTHCDEVDTTEHVINFCTLHDEARKDLKNNLHHTGKVSALLVSQKKHTAEVLANFLIKIEQARKTRQKEEEQELEANMEPQKLIDDMTPKPKATRNKSILKKMLPTTAENQVKKNRQKDEEKQVSEAKKPESQKTTANLQP